MRTTRFLAGALGVAVMLYAVYGAVTDPGSRLWGQVRFLAEVLIVHDFVLLPAGIGVGVLAGRLLPATSRRVVQGALWASAVVTLVALPSIVGNGHPPDNPSALPRNYPAGLLLVVAAIWLAATATLVIRRQRRKQHPADGT